LEASCQESVEEDGKIPARFVARFFPLERKFAVLLPLLISLHTLMIRKAKDLDLSNNGLAIKSLPSLPTFSLFTITYYFPKIGSSFLVKSE